MNSDCEESRKSFATYIKNTKNTVCGRHPIGVLLAALSKLEEDEEERYEIRFTRYEVSFREMGRFVGVL